jgi:hypothetical protein
LKFGDRDISSGSLVFFDSKGHGAYGKLLLEYIHNTITIFNMVKN